MKDFVHVEGNVSNRALMSTSPLKTVDLSCSQNHSSLQILMAMSIVYKWLADSALRLGGTTVPYWLRLWPVGRQESYFRLFLAFLFWWKAVLEPRFSLSSLTEKCTINPYRSMDRFCELLDRFEGRSFVIDDAKAAMGTTFHGKALSDRTPPYNELVRVQVLGTVLHLTIIVGFRRWVSRQHPAGPGFGSKRPLLYCFANLSWQLAKGLKDIRASHGADILTAECKWNSSRPLTWWVA